MTMSGVLSLDCGNSIPIEFNLHSCYYNDFFLLRVLISINGSPAKIEIDSTGTSVIKHSAKRDVSLSSLVPWIATALSQKYGVYHVDTFWHEKVQAALFLVVFSSKTSVRKFLENKERIKLDLAKTFTFQLGTRRDVGQSDQDLISHAKHEELMSKVSTDVELFLASPQHSTDQPKVKVYKITLATFEHNVDKWQTVNCLTLTAVCSVMKVWLNNVWKVSIVSSRLLLILAVA